MGGERNEWVMKVRGMRSRLVGGGGVSNPRRVHYTSSLVPLYLCASSSACSHLLSIHLCPCLSPYPAYEEIYLFQNIKRIY